MTGSGELPDDTAAGGGPGAAVPVRRARRADLASPDSAGSQAADGRPRAAGTVTRTVARMVARTAAGLARACHPGPAAAVTTLVTALVSVAGWGPAGTALTALAVLTGQLSVGWCNDVVDAARDAAGGRTAKPIVAGLVSARTVRAAAFAALAACVPLSLACGVVAGATHLFAVAAAWVYNLWLKGTAASWAPYAAGFGAVPVFVTAGTPGHALPVSLPAPLPAWWVVLAAALLGCAAHLANVLPDIETDVATGVRGWPQRLGAARVRVVLPLPLLAASVLLVVAPPGPAGPAGWLALAGVAACAAAGLLLGRRVPVAPFAAAVGAAGIDVLLLAATPGVITAG
ncbi:UbiA family prenyltransferase [Microbispora siamensis]|uniref:UbiA family prenyltransferase n=1 Tax=Microbispora siamensis TaxID=564413 RepID=UPI001EF3AD2D|nr:UbiA family prenyltransferase [Microbispora siamensis]